MKIKARDGKVYEVSSAPPGGSHQVTLDGVAVGSFILEPRETKVTVTGKTSEETLVDIADRFVDQGGSPMGIA